MNEVPEQCHENPPPHHLIEIHCTKLTNGYKISDINLHKDDQF